MRRIAPFSRTRVVVSVVIGLVAFVVQAISVWDHPTGDDPARIKEVNALLEQTTGCLYEVTSPDGREIRVFQHTLPSDSELSAMFAALPKAQAHKSLIEIPEYDTTAEWPEDVKSAEIIDTLRKKFPPKEAAVRSVWKDVTAASYRLTDGNRQILRAKAMQYLSENPDNSSSYTWENRFELARRNFNVCTKAGRIWRSMGFGVLAYVISTPLTWLALIILAYIWYFLLDRLSGVSQAIRGKSASDARRPHNGST